MKREASITNVVSKCSLLFILGEYCDEIENSNEIIEQYIEK